MAGLCFSSTGVDLYDAYSTEIFENFGFPSHWAQISSTFFNFAGLLAAIFTVFCVDLVPRRKLLISTLVCCFFAALSIMVLWTFRVVFGSSQILGFCAVALLSIATFAYGLGKFKKLKY